MKDYPILPRIEELEPYTPGLSIVAIQKKYGLNQVIKMASNENPLGVSPLAQEAMLQACASAFRYPQGGNPRLRGALGHLHGVPPEKIAVGNGSDEILDVLIRILAQSPMHNIVCFAPCFSIYPIQARVSGVEIRRQPLNSDFSFDFDSLIALADAQTRLVFITTPDNPSGYCPTLEAVRKLAADLAVQAPGALLVIDEAYIDFADTEKNFSLLANHVLPDNVAFCRTFSKSWGLAGARLGYAILPEPIAEAFWRARLPFSVNTLAEAGALGALEDEYFRAATLETVREGRKRLKSGLEELGCRVWPSQANFLMCEPPNAEHCYRKLLQRGIIVRWLKSYGLPHLLRISIGNNNENETFLRALGKILEGAA